MDINEKQLLELRRIQKMHTIPVEPEPKSRVSRILNKIFPTKPLTEDDLKGIYPGLEHLCQTGKISKEVLEETKKLPPEKFRYAMKKMAEIEKNYEKK